MSAYSLYELFRTLIERVGWPSEEEKRAALESVTEAERMQIFGNLASSMACNHQLDASGKCELCGRQVENTAAPAGNRYARGPQGIYNPGGRRGW